MSVFYFGTFIITVKRISQINAFDAGLIALGAALNITVGYLVILLKIPLYLDSIGTILVASLCGWRYGIIVGLTALAILTVTSIPTIFAFAGTVVVISLVTSALTRIGFLKNLKMTIIGGLVIGICAAIVSSPVTTFVYGGVTLAGSDLITVLFKTTGLPLWLSVLMSSLITDPIDKLSCALICFVLIKSLPPRMLERLRKH